MVAEKLPITLVVRFASPYIGLSRYYAFPDWTKGTFLLSVFTILAGEYAPAVLLSVPDIIYPEKLPLLPMLTIILCL